MTLGPRSSPFQLLPEQITKMIARRHYCSMVLAFGLGIGTSSLHAADDTAQFLDAMRNRGYFDLALEYLDSVGSSGVTSDEFKSRVGYERGMTLMGKWRQAPSSERDRIAQQITVELTAYAKANPENALAAEALTQLGTMQLQSATRHLYTLRNRPQTPAKEAELRAEAFRGFSAARGAFVDVEKTITALLEKIPKALDPKTQAAEIKRRDDLREQLARVRTFKAYSLLESANAVGKDHADYVKLNEQAAAEFQEMYDKYSDFKPAAQARVYQGDCYLNIGKTKEASGCYEDVIVQWGEITNFRDVVTKAHVGQAQCYILEKKYKDVIAKQGAWLAKSERGEAREPEWLRLKYQVAEAKRLQGSDEKEKEAARKKLLSEARDHYSDVALLPGEFQKQARERLKELGGATATSAPKTFDEALQAGKEAISSLAGAQEALKQAQTEANEDPDATRQQLSEGFRVAAQHLEHALSLVDDDTPLAKVNEARRLLSWLFWQDEQYYRSAVLSSFLARRYPEDPSSSAAAQVALASYEKLYQQAVAGGNPEAGEVEAERLKDLASFITRRWSNHSLSETAFSVLLNFSIRESRYNAALELVKQLEPERQAAFTARVANAMWEAQLRGSTTDMPEQERNQLRGQASQLLKQSFEPLKKDTSATTTLAASSLYLLQALLDEGDYPAAIRVLEDPKAGGLALVKTPNPVASRPVYAVEVYKHALRAYVSVVPSQTDKAMEIMALLDEAVGKLAGGEDKLTKVYLGLGLQLQKQIEELNASGNSEEAQRVGKAFVTFLDKLAERDTTDPMVAQWIAQTYFKLAEGLAGDSAAAADRIAYYQKARDAFKGLMDKVEDPKLKLGLQIQYAQSLRRTGEYQQAMLVFEEILAEKEAMLDVQKAAAYTLQEWGADSDPSKFSDAIGGTGPKNARGKPIIWGWSYLASVSAQAARTRPELKPLFYECWLNQAQIRYLRASKATGNEKTKQLDAARKVVSTMVTNYSDFLDTPLRQDFDTLMKQIQTAEGKRATGLKEFGIAESDNKETEAATEL
jgi:tetratricopeptide (TPR) repeat protein